MFLVSRPHPTSTLRHYLTAGSCGASLAGLGVAALTLRLNPHLLDPWTDAGLLLLEMAAGAGLAGLLAGWVGWALWAGPARLGAPERSLRGLGYVLLSGLALGPVAYVLLLPDLGLAGPGFLTDLLFGASWLRRSIVSLVALTILTLLGWLLGRIASFRWALVAWSVYCSS